MCAALEPAALQGCARANWLLRCICHGKVSSAVRSLMTLQVGKSSQLESCTFSNTLDKGVQRWSAGVTAYIAKLSPEQKGLGLLNLDFGSHEAVVSCLLCVKPCENTEH